MDQNHAGQIAALLNTRNQLVKNYDVKAILAARARFLFEVRDDQVVGCVEVKKGPVVSGGGQSPHGPQGLLPAGDRASTSRCCYRACHQKQSPHLAVYDNNVESTGLFLKNGFVRTALFLYPDSGNNVGVYQKVLSPPKRPD
jgi:hypothetical protein